MKEELNSLKAFTKDCRDDMHEPDEQEMTAFVVGTHFDNAYGEHIGEKQITEGYQEIVVILKNGNRESHKINLATLIALARKANLS